MLYPLMILAFMAGSSACPDLCECHPMSQDLPSISRVSCSGTVPSIFNSSSGDIGRLDISNVEEYEVTNFFDNLSNVSRGLPNLRVLSVTNCSLESFNVTHDGLENLRVLNLSSNNFLSFRDVQIVNTVNLSNLLTLDVSYNSMSELSAGDFRTLPNLQRLHLRRNSISSLAVASFQDLRDLRVLDLADNELASLPDPLLVPLESLEALDLGGNQLQILGSKWFERLVRLQELDVSRNGLAKASGALQPLQSLTVLRLAENPLSERDVSLFLGAGRLLKTVDASRIGLTRVPAVLTQSVRELRLEGNNLVSIRCGDLDSYPWLNLLDVSNNRLVDIEEDALGRLGVLERLYLSGNLLKGIPKSLPSSLRVLDIQHNLVETLDDLQGLNNLQALVMNDNSIAEIKEGSFGQLPVLKELDISNNPIKRLSSNALSGPGNLAVVRMSGLILLEPSEEEMGDMTFPVSAPERLSVLDVSRSPVLAEQLLQDNAALSACRSLSELNLSETNITGIRSDLIYILPQLKRLGLGGNEFNCSEDLYWLGEWLRHHGEMTPRAFCNAPMELSDTPLYDLPRPPLSPETTTASSTSSSSTSATSPFFTTRVIEQTPLSNVPNGSASSPSAAAAPSTTTFPSTSTNYPEKLEASNDTKVVDVINGNDVVEATTATTTTVSSKSVASKYQFYHSNKVSSMSQTKSAVSFQVEKRNVSVDDLSSNTVAEELSGQVLTDSGARVSESFSAGAHPGMLVLAGAVLGAVVALTLVLSRKTTIRRTDRYQRQENIEVHILTPTTDVW